ncbi:MAG: Uncharacterized protein Caur_1846 [uncultured Thermomicrobiales bacterium]|uniref:Uncharacterized protein Caur_1846 n=1 Tax=uncultured Thermomicrobiales bacterium TaxID=1645740 RepID=A0A6J4UBX1_9BACT|nr:MAG: Uncharacterized protein Caur_1846 [uncultured Thermomicrobiales bacterium]
MKTDRPQREQTDVRGVKKQDLPTKVCATCGRPFTWRKKWARDWESVRYCSDRCRTHRTDATAGAARD